MANMALHKIKTQYEAEHSNTNFKSMEIEHLFSYFGLNCIALVSNKNTLQLSLREKENKNNSAFFNKPYCQKFILNT